MYHKKDAFCTGRTVRQNCLETLDANFCHFFHFLAQLLHFDDFWDSDKNLKVWLYHKAVLYCTHPDSRRLMQTHADLCKLKQTQADSHRLTQTNTDSRRLKQTCADSCRLAQTCADSHRLAQTNTDLHRLLQTRNFTHIYT